MKKGFVVLIVMWILSNPFIQAGQPDDQNVHLVHDKTSMVHGYVRLATAIVQQSYQFFAHDKKEYNFQDDVLNVPYKNMVYASTQAIERLFDDANRYDNPAAQTKALILLCRMPVPEWYFKSFQKGLDALYKASFDELGNFKAVPDYGDIRLVFKEYCKKTPACWQDLAKISSWWCKNKQAYPIHTKYYAMTCTEHNEELLAIINADQLHDLVHLKYLVLKNGSSIGYKIYDYYIAHFLKIEIDGSNFKK